MPNTATTAAQIDLADLETDGPSVVAETDAAPPVEMVPPPPAPDEAPRMRRRVRDWIRALYRDPGAEERAIEDRRARLLGEINEAVAAAPDDIPIKQLIEQLNRHHDD